MPGASPLPWTCPSLPTPIPATATSSTSFARFASLSAAGLPGIHIEDQEFPKKCGHLEGKQIILREDYVAKIRAAAAARADKDFMIIARTDARAVAGLDEAVARANAALAAGADMAFVEAPQTQQEVAAVPRLVNGPCLLNVVRGGKTPDLDLQEAEAMGYKLAIVPGLLIKSVVGICDQMLAELKSEPPPSDAGQGDHCAGDVPPLRRRRMGRAAYPVSRRPNAGRGGVIGRCAGSRQKLHPPAARVGRPCAPAGGWVGESPQANSGVTVLTSHRFATAPPSPPRGQGRGACAAEGQHLPTASFIATG